MKTYLMRGVLEFSQSPELLAIYPTSKKVIHEIPDSVINHRAFYNIESVRSSISTRRNKIKPFISHLLELKHFQRTRIRKLVVIDIRRPLTAVRPANGLPQIISAIEPPREVLGKLCLADLRRFYDFFTGMINKHTLIIQIHLVSKKQNTNFG